MTKNYLTALIISLFSHAAALSQDFSCEIMNGFKRCISVYDYPSGPLVIADLFDGVNSWPLKRTITGALNGTKIIGNVRLNHHARGGWVVQINAGNFVIIPEFSLQNNKPIEFFAEGVAWEVVVMKQKKPIFFEGHASEEDFTLDLVISPK